MQILRDLSIKDNLKKDLAEQIFQIEKDLAINYTHSSSQLKNSLKVGDYVKDSIKEYRIVFINIAKNTVNARIRHTTIIKENIPLRELTKII